MHAYMHLCTLGGSQIKVCKLYFDIVITHNDHPSYVKYVLGGIYMFFTLLGNGLCAVGGGGGCLPMKLETTYLCSFSPVALGTSNRNVQV